MPTKHQRASEQGTTAYPGFVMPSCGLAGLPTNDWTSRGWAV
jgi:hypothetical protein